MHNNKFNMMVQKGSKSHKIVEGYHFLKLQLFVKGHVNPKMLLFFLICVECIPKVLHKSFIFFSIQAHFDPRNHL